MVEAFPKPPGFHEPGLHQDPSLEPPKLQIWTRQSLFRGGRPLPQAATGWGRPDDLAPLEPMESKQISKNQPGVEEIP